MYGREARCTAWRKSPVLPVLSAAWRKGQPWWLQVWWGCRTLADTDCTCVPQTRTHPPTYPHVHTRTHTHTPRPLPPRCDNITIAPALLKELEQSEGPLPYQLWPGMGGCDDPRVLLGADAEERFRQLHGEDQ